LNQKTAIQFADYVLEKLPFRVEQIQNDNGAEFQSGFHWHLLDRVLRQDYIRPSTPRLNGKVERSHRIDDEEFYLMLDHPRCAIDQPATQSPTAVQVTSTAHAADTLSESELLRDAVQVLDQELMDAEVTDLVGAEPHQRMAGRTSYRSGYRDREWDTRIGTMELQIPNSARAPTSRAYSSHDAGMSGRCCRWCRRFTSTASRRGRSPTSPRRSALRASPKTCVSIAARSGAASRAVRSLSNLIATPGLAWYYQSSARVSRFRFAVDLSVELFADPADRGEISAACDRNSIVVGWNPLCKHSRY